MPNIINPNCLSLPQQVEKNSQDILKLFASNLEELTGLQFIPNAVDYVDGEAILNGKFIVKRDGSQVEVDGVVNLPIFGDDGINVDSDETSSKIRISIDNEILSYVEELINNTTDENQIIFTNNLTNFFEKNGTNTKVLYDIKSDDININLGYTAGIPNDATINLNTNAYDGLLVLGVLGGSQGHNVFVNLKTPEIDSVYYGVENYKTGDYRYIVMRVSVNDAKTTLKVTIKDFFNTAEDRTNGCYISKIIGFKFGRG